MHRRRRNDLENIGVVATVSALAFTGFMPLESSCDQCGMNPHLNKAKRRPPPAFAPITGMSCEGAMLYRGRKSAACGKPK